MAVKKLKKTRRISVTYYKSKKNTPCCDQVTVYTFVRKEQVIVQDVWKKPWFLWENNSYANTTTLCTKLPKNVVFDTMGQNFGLKFVKFLAISAKQLKILYCQVIFENPLNCVIKLQNLCLMWLENAQMFGTFLSEK